MANPTKIQKRDVRYFADDGEKRGPLTMYRLAFHPTEHVLFAACSDRRLAMWQLDGAITDVKKVGKVNLATLICPHEVGWIRCMCITGDGKTIFTGGSDRTIRKWSWSDKTASEKPLLQTNAHLGWVEDISVSPDGKTLVSVSADRTVALWNTDSLTQIKKITKHEGYVRQVSWSADSSFFVTASEDGSIIKWSSKTLEPQLTLTFGEVNDGFGQTPTLSGVHSVSISRDDRYIAAAGGKMLAVFDSKTGKLVTGDKSNTQVAFSPKNDLLAVGSDSAQVIAYDPSKFNEITIPKNAKSLPTPGVPGKIIANIKLGGFSLGVAFDASGKHLAFGKADGSVELWELS